VLPDGQVGYIQNGDIVLESPISHKGDLVPFSQQFLGLPYTWGGRSSFGYDCSGFVQMLYSQIGVDLQRNSGQQILDPRLQKISRDDLELGDLIFFGKSEQRIMHVGMYIGEGNFIHSSARECRPWLRMSSLSDPEWCGSSAAYYPYRTFRKLNARHTATGQKE
jgi:gamma-D-glutamyl-L-lysine dipeptidyl-peptidase